MSGYCLSASVEETGKNSRLTVVRAIFNWLEPLSGGGGGGR